MTETKPSQLNFGMVLAAGLMAALAIMLHPRISVHLVPLQYMPKLRDILWLSSVMFVGMGGFVLWKKQSPLQLWKENAWFNIWAFVFLLGIALCSNRIHAMDHKWARILIYLGLLLQLLKSYHLLVVKPEAKGWRMRISTFLLPLFALFLLSEIAFLFIAQPHGAYPESLAQINWNRKYWGEPNGLGYRDGPVSRAKGKKQVLVMGDSFTAGSGVKRREDRFTDLLEAKYGQQAVFLNLGAAGSNTPQEFRRLHEASLDPDLIILGYCLNDIHDAAGAEGVKLEWKPPGSNFPDFTRPLMHYSHTFNYLFGIYGFGFTQMDYFGWLEDCFTNPAILARHHQDLDKIVEFARKDAIPVAAIVFPLMQAPERSVKLTGIVSDYFRSRQVPVVDMGPKLQNYPADSLWVRPLDPHPNEFVNSQAADFLAELIEKFNLL